MIFPDYAELGKSVNLTCKVRGVINSEVDFPDYAEFGKPVNLTCKVRGVINSEIDFPDYTELGKSVNQGERCNQFRS